jgi:methionyl-tRNA formyltransferase
LTPLSTSNPRIINSPLRIVFAGTPVFARVALEGLHLGGHRIVGVLTQPDRPAGRGLKLQASAVKSYAIEHSLSLIQPRSLRLDGKYPQDAQEAQDKLKIWRPDVIVVAAYGLILPAWTLQAAPLGCLNIHASLLPRWRGAAPIHRAIEAGDKETGICIMQMDAGLDTGGILTQQSCPVLTQDTTDTLHDRLCTLGVQLLLDTLANIGSLTASPQPDEGVSYAHKIEKIETWIDWEQASKTIERKLRAFSSAPGLQTHIAGEVFKIWGGEALATQPTDKHSLPVGSILNISTTGIEVLCGSGVFQITQIQRAGGKRMPMESFVLGRSLREGDRFEMGPRCLNP